MFMNVIGRGQASAKREFEPAAALALRADFAAANEIALRDDADQLAGGIDHRKPTDMLSQHDMSDLVEHFLGRQHAWIDRVCSRWARM